MLKCIVEVHRASNGNLRGKLLIEIGKGSFRITNILTARDWVVVNDNQNRVLIYALATGALRGRVFGSRAAVNAIRNLLCVENERGQLTVHDLQTMQKRDEFTFAQPVSYVSFNAEGTKLFVLTANQMVYWLNLTGAQ